MKGNLDGIWLSINLWFKGFQGNDYKDEWDGRQNISFIDIWTIYHSNK